MEKQKILMLQELEDCITEIGILLREAIFKADQKANEHRAQASYRADMQGYNREVELGT